MSRFAGHGNSSLPIYVVTHRGIKKIDFGVDFFWVYQSAYGASVLLMKKVATVKVKKFSTKKNALLNFLNLVVFFH
jgi:hypothetical protein